MVDVVFEILLFCDCGVCCFLKIISIFNCVLSFLNVIGSPLPTSSRAGDSTTDPKWTEYCEQSEISQSYFPEGYLANVGSDISEMLQNQAIQSDDSSEDNGSTQSSSSVNSNDSDRSKRRKRRNAKKRQARRKKRTRRKRTTGNNIGKDKTKGSRKKPTEGYYFVLSECAGVLFQLLF